jgi:hypothetical protein
MQVFHVTKGPMYPTYSLSNNKKKLTVEGVLIDLEAASMDDCQNILNITRNSDGSCVLGLGGKAGYVADIEIPPRQFRYETTGEGEEAETKKIPLPFDSTTVVLKLWPCCQEETNLEGGMTNAGSIH